MAKKALSLEREHEAQLIIKARCGDRVAVCELVDGHKDRLFSFIWRMVRNHHDAEEICQDAFLKAFAALDSYSSNYRFSTWLFTIGYRVCLNHLRRKRPLTGEVEFSAMAHDEEPDGPTSLASQDAKRLQERVWAAVDRLSPPQRATVLLFYRHETSCQEIARVLELPVATVKSHLHRARKRLQDMLSFVREEQWQDFRNLGRSAG